MITPMVCVNWNYSNLLKIEGVVYLDHHWSYGMDEKKVPLFYIGVTTY